MTGRTSPKKIRTLQLAAVIFFTVSGGPYGLEPLLQYAGNNLAILLLCIVPFLWDIPAILTVLELNSMMPVAGGYYKWVKTALGTRFGFYEGMWTWFYTFVDLAIYPVLFVQYTSYLFPGMEAYKIPACLFIIWGSAALNIIGIVPVGRMSFVLSNLVLMPFVLMIVIFLSSHAAVPPPVAATPTFPLFGMALYTIMWNFLGWDSATTYAEEVENPVRSYIVSVAIAFLSVLAIYLAIIFVAQRSGINYASLTQQGFPALGTLLSGRWLGVLIACGGMASSIGLYNANILSVSRVPKAMADDGLLPVKLSAVHPRFGTPYISIILCSVIVSFMVLRTFADLVVIDVTIYGAGLFLEFFSLIKMRLKAPDMHRPFRIPLGVPGLCLLIALPIALYVTALAGVCMNTTNGINPAYAAIVILAITEVAWQILVWRRPGLKNS
jgi:amino acid transporter